MTERIELKPCPFCGSERMNTVKWNDVNWTVYCRVCGAYGPASSICGEDDEKERDEAREMWNKAPRATP